MAHIEPSLDGAGLRIAIARSRFNEEVGRASLEACLVRLMELGVHERDVTVVAVPGALETPLALQKLAGTGRYEALIAIGAVIRGETYHFEVVSNESAAGLTQVQLDTGIPVANGILTTDTDEQALARAAVKGRDCAEVAVEMANLMRSVDRQHK
jgi:6,7-dimethyl-8-ribityllumazine synthase